MRALPMAAVITIVLPLAEWWLLGASSDRGPWWVWLLVLAVTVGLAVVVQRYMGPPRPSVDERVGQAQWGPATTAATKTGELPACPEVRTAVGVAACASIEGLVATVALLVGVGFSTLIVPDLWTALTPVTVMTVILAFRARRGWAYLRALHAAEHTS